MKATGIVRRIDDLGRIVIPKEIRRTLRIREGDPLEIYTDSQGGVIFKKYSPVGEMSSSVLQYAEVLSKLTAQPVLVCDSDHVVAAAGISKREVLDRRITAEIEEYMHDRRAFVWEPKSPEVFAAEGISRPAVAAFPIIVSSDVIGEIILLSDVDEAKEAQEVQAKLTQAAAMFIASQMEQP